LFSVILLEFVLIPNEDILFAESSLYYFYYVYKALRFLAPATTAVVGLFLLAPELFPLKLLMLRF